MFISYIHYATITSSLMLSIFIVFFRFLLSIEVGGFLPTNCTSNSMANAFEARENSFASRQEAVCRTHHSRFCSLGKTASERCSTFRNAFDNRSSIASSNSLSNTFSDLKSTTRDCESENQSQKKIRSSETISGLCLSICCEA